MQQHIRRFVAYRATERRESQRARLKNGSAAEEALAISNASSKWRNQGSSLHVLYK